MWRSTRAATSILCAKQSAGLIPTSYGSIIHQEVGYKASWFIGLYFWVCLEIKIKGVFIFLKKGVLMCTTWPFTPLVATTEAGFCEKVKAPNQIWMQNNKVTSLHWSNIYTSEICASSILSWEHTASILDRSRVSRGWKSDIGIA